MTLLLGAAVSFAVLVAAVRWATRRGPRKFTPTNVTLHETPTVAVGLRRSPGQRRAIAGLRLSDGGTR